MWWSACGVAERPNETRDEDEGHRVPAGEASPVAASPTHAPGLDWPASDDVRVGDAEREDVVEALTHHYGAGRLDQVEFEQRALQAFSATTHGQLRAALDGLPPVTTRRAAVSAAAADRRSALRALAGWLRFNALFIGIWLVTSIASGELLFFWPVFALFFSGLHTVPSALRRLSTSTRAGLEAART